MVGALINVFYPNRGDTNTTVHFSFTHQRAKNPVFAVVIIQRSETKENYMLFQFHSAAEQ